MLFSASYYKYTREEYEVSIPLLYRIHCILAREKSHFAAFAAWLLVPPLFRKGPPLLLNEMNVAPTTRLVAA